LLRLADDDVPQIRSDTAYALGKLGTPAAIEQLETMVDDPDADTRYNAAVALAHHGNTRATETLAEMLDPEESAGIRGEATEQDRAFKRAVIVSTAIEAAQQLARANTDADLSIVVEALQRLADADAETLAQAQLPPRAASAARQALKTLSKTTEN
jgi:HEAT repeat protein